jgi:tetratricopeptide (TPR) repeat protein
MLEFLRMPEDPRHAAEDHYYRALDLFSDNQHELAVDEYKKAIELDPTFTDAMHGLTRAYQDLGRLDEAITIARMITAHDPEDILGHTSLSILFQKKGMVPEAEAEANQARILGWKQQLKAKK